jgi:AAA domain
MVTTREVLAEERRMLELERAGRGQFPPLAPDYRPEREGRLTPEQRRAVELVAASRDQVVCVRGAAGTGKTTLMREVREAARAAGRELHAFAPTAGSADMLRRDGFEGAETVARLLVDRKLQEAARGRVLLVDEAGLLGVGTMREVLELARRQDCRVILSGDTRQHKSVERGDALRLLIEHGGVRPAEVTGIRRQRAAKFREAVREISEQKFGAAFDRLERLGLIVEIPGDGPRHELLARDYLHAVGEGKTALIVAPTHAEGRQVTDVVRAGLRRRGELAAEERKVPRLVNTQWTRAERASARLYEPGMVVEFHARCGDFRRGERASVAGCDEGGRVLVERDYGPISVRDGLPLAEAEKFAVFRREEIGVAAGDLLRVTRNGKTLEGARINNGSLVRVREVSDDGHLVLENGRMIRGDYGHLDYGYAVTSQAAQGKTVDRTFAAVGGQSLPAATREGFYVTNSRSREFTRTYVDDLAAYREAVTGGRERMSALDLVGRDRGPGHEQSIGVGRDSEFARQRPESARQQDRALLHEQDRGYGFSR